MRDIRLFIDDDRIPFDGWIVARDYLEAMQYFDDTQYRIQELSFDWCMGVNQPSGKYIAGKVIEQIASGNRVLSEANGIYFHSSDRAAASQMAKMFTDAQRSGHIPKACLIRLNTNCRTDYGRIIQ